MKKIQYVFWVLFVFYFAGRSGLSFAQVLFIAGIAMLLFMNIVNYFEGNAGNGLPTFNDVVAKELMRIRSDLIGLRANQVECNDEEKVSDNFLQLFMLYLPYSSSFLCTVYKTPNNQWGKIIMELDSSIDIDNHGLIKLDTETLKKINSTKVARKFKNGMNLPVYISEPGMNDAELSRHAKIISIKNKSSAVDASVTITLEINVSTSYDEMYFSYDDSENANKETIIRNVEVSGFSSCRHFKVDKY